MIEISFSKKLVMSILDSEYGHYIDDSSDDSEFMPLLRRIIDSACEALNSETSEQSKVSQLKDDLHQYALEKYIAIWITHAHEDDSDDIDLKKERQAAIENFEEHYR